MSLVELEFFGKPSQRSQLLNLLHTENINSKRYLPSADSTVVVDGASVAAEGASDTAAVAVTVKCGVVTMVTRAG